MRTAKIIETANTINPAIAITPLATNFERPNPNTRSEIAPADKIKKNINNQGNELMLISLKLTWNTSVKYVGNQIKNNVMINCTTKY